MLGIPLGVPPEDYGSYLKAQRAGMLAQALTGQAASPLQAPETAPVRGLYVQPRVGIGSIVGKLGQALLANRMTKKSIADQAGLMQGMEQAYAPGGQEIPQTDQPQQPPAQDAPPMIRATPEQLAASGQPQEMPQPTPPQPQQVPTMPVNPRNPQGLPADVVARLAMTDPKDYAQMLAGPQAVQLGRLAGMSPQAAAAGAYNKQAALDARPGGAIYLPDGRVIRNPVLAQGEMPVTDASGNVVDTAMLPHHIANQAALTAAETAAKEYNTPREIPIGGGREQLGYPPPPPAMGGSGQAAGAAQGGSSPPAAPAAPQAPQGIWSTVPKLQVPNTPGQTSDAYTMGNLEEASKKKAQLVDENGQAASLANQQLQYNREALQALPTAEVGPMSEWLTTNRQRLIELGVPASVIPSSGTVTPTLALNKYLLNAALQGARQIYGSRMTQNEVKLQTEEMSPSAHMTADAIRSLVQQNDVLAQYSVQRNADLQRYLNAGGDPQQFEAWYNSRRPVTEFAAMQSLTPQQRATALQRFSQHPDSRGEFQAKLGWDPVNWQ